MSRKKDQAGTFELLARLPQQIISLAQIEYENAKREILSRVKRAGIGAASILVAIFFVFFMIQAFVIAAIAALALIWPWWLAALTVAGVLLLCGVAAILTGIALMKRANPVPENTIERVVGDISALGEVRVGAGQEQPSSPGNGMPVVGQEGNWR